MMALTASWKASVLTRIPVTLSSLMVFFYWAGGQWRNVMILRHDAITYDPRLRIMTLSPVMPSISDHTKY
jgi:hypothetical protein